MPDTELLKLVADIRKAVGDPEGKLMQPELVKRCRKLKALEDWVNEGNRVKATAIKDGWIVESAPEWNATLLIDP